MRPALHHSVERDVSDSNVQYLSCSQSSVLNLHDGLVQFHAFEAPAKDHVTVITAAGIGDLNFASWRLCGCHLCTFTVFCNAYR